MTLIDRLSKLDGPDREADREIAKLFNMPWDYSAEWIKKRDEAGNRFDVPVAFPYTASVDATIALAESVLPGHQVNVTHFHASHGEASIGNRLIAKPSSGSNPAIALCIALLRAKEVTKP